MLLAAGVAAAQTTSNNLKASAGTTSVFAQWHGERGLTYNVFVTDTTGALVFDTVVAGYNLLIGDLDTNRRYLLTVAQWDDPSNMQEDSVAFRTGSLAGTSGCPTPHVVATSVRPHAIDLAWAPGYRENSWRLEYKAQNDTAWTTATANTTRRSYTLDSLSPATTYLILLTALCQNTVVAVPLTVSTPCVTTLPWQEGFETWGTANPVPPCWSICGNSPTPYVTLYNGESHSGTASLQFNSWRTYYHCVALPYMATMPDSLVLSFWIRSLGSGSCFDVGVMTDPLDTFSFVPLYTVTTPYNVWTHVELLLSSYRGYGHHVAIISHTGHSATTFVDDVRLELRPDCLWPSNLVLQTVSPTSLGLSWHERGTASQWLVEYDTVPPGSPLSTPRRLTTGDTLCTIPGLQHVTTYYVGVRSLCGADTSAPICDTFATACQWQLPLNEDFENFYQGQADQLAPCWYRYEDLSGGIVYPYISSQYHHSGRLSLYLYSSSNKRAYIATPYIGARADSLTVSFWLYSGRNTHDMVRVGVMSNPNDISSFTAVDTVWAHAASTWEYFEVPLSAYRGSGHFIALSAGDNYSTAFIDDLSVFYTSECYRPRHLGATDMTHDACRLAWLGPDSAVRWLVEYGPQGFAPGSQVGSLLYANDTSCRLTALQPATTYDVYVSALCSTDTSPSINISFTTRCAPLRPPITQRFDGSISDCYTIGNSCAGQSSSTPVLTNSRYGITGAYSLQLKSTTGCNSYLALPAVAASPDSLMLSFWLYKPDTAYPTPLVVGVMDVPGNPLTFTPVRTVVPDTVGAWELFDVPLAGYGGSGRYVTLLSPDNAASNLYVDDIVLDYAPRCMRPTAFWLDSVASDSAWVRWKAVPGVQRYELSVTAADSLPQTGTITQHSTATARLGSFDYGTRHDVYLRAVCGAASVSQWVGPLLVANGAYLLRKDVWHDTVSLCGTILYDDGGPNGNYSSSLSNWITLTPHDSHPVRIKGSVNLKAHDNIYVWDGYFFAANNQLANLSGTHASVGPFTASNPDGVLTLELSFRSGGPSDRGFEFFVTCDDYFCDPVANLTPLAVRARSATLQWTPGGSESRWLIACDTSFDFGNASYYVADSIPTYTIRDLRPDMLYVVSVRPICNGDTGVAVYTAFQTDTGSADLAITNPQTLNGELAVYPNPVSQGSDITVKLPYAETDATLQLYDMTGRLLYTAHPKQQSLNSPLRYQNIHWMSLHISTFNFSKSAYFLKLTTPTATLTQKIIVR